MNAPKRRTNSTYRLTPELDKKITEQAQIFGISKNAFVQQTLVKALELDKDYPRTGTC